MVKSNINSGDKFGRLTVIEKVAGRGRAKYKCKCDCGIQKTVLGYNLKSMNTTSCGCYNHDIRKKRKKDITGRTFGLLTVIGDSGDRVKSGDVLWDCRCMCGLVTTAQGRHLKSGIKSNCGCVKRSEREEYKKTAEYKAEAKKRKEKELAKRREYNKLDHVRKRKNEYEKKRYIKNIDSRKINDRESHLLNVKKCTDRYVKKQLMKLGVFDSPKDIPLEIIEIKRDQILLTREIRKCKNGIA